MKTGLLSLLVVGLLGSGIGMAYAVTEKDASPTLKERLTKDTVLGVLLKKEGSHYSIQTDAGVRKIHTDQYTKIDRDLKLGDTVKAYITDKDYATTLERDN